MKAALYLSMMILVAAVPAARAQDDFEEPSAGEEVTAGTESAVLGVAGSPAPLTLSQRYRWAESILVING